MYTLEELLKKWSCNTPPPHHQPLLYDSFVTMEISGKEFSGVISWNHALKQYTFQPATNTSPTAYELYEITVDSQLYLQIRDIIRSQLGVFVTRGIYDKQTKPLSYTDQLPAGFEVSIVKS